MSAQTGGLGIFPETVLTIGPVRVSDTVFETWIVMAIIALVSLVLTRRLSVYPTGRQGIAESVVEAMEETVKDVLQVDPWQVIPVLGTLWIFIGFSNLAGLLPGLSSPTSDLNTTVAFAIVSFSTTHIYGFYTRGFVGHLRHYADPSWLLMPFLVIAEVTRTVALAVRLFGNMVSADIIAVILFGLAGLFVPVAFDLLHVVIGLIQAYIFGVLTLVFIAEGVSETPSKGA